MSTISRINTKADSRHVLSPVKKNETLDETIKYPEFFKQQTVALIPNNSSGFSMLEGKK
jgi:hypothetical protein